MSNIFLSTTFSKDNEKLSDVLNKISKYNIINKVELGSNHKYQKNYKFITKYNFDFLTHNYFPPLKKEVPWNLLSAWLSFLSCPLEQLESLQNKDHQL